MINEDFSVRAKLKDIGRWYINKYVINVASKLPDKSLLLDAGAGESVYKKFFSHCNYKAIDLAVGESRWNYSNLDYVGPLDDMPIENEIFDAVLCTQVLEHLEWPRESLDEMYRVLKKGGKIYITAPMSHREHQVPYDFFRYTSYGLKSLCEKAGFVDIKVFPFGGFWVRWAYELPKSLSVFPSSGLKSGNINLMGIILLPIKAFFMLMIPLVQMFFLWLDNFDYKKTDTFGWCCEAEK